MSEYLRTIAKINDVEIQVVNNGEKRVPIKPICEALGINEESQRRRILADEIMGSTTSLEVVVASDGKKREMLCLPYKYVFGWVLTISTKNIKPEAKEDVKKYRKECYDTLYNHYYSKLR